MHSIGSEARRALNPDREQIPWLVLMMKAPEPGKVKTRLAAEIGVEQATELYRGFVEDLSDRILRAGGWRTVIAFTPADSERGVRDWLANRLGPETLFLAQSEGDLGQRLACIFGKGFKSGARSIVALGADCLDIEADEIREGFAALEREPLLMGEATDGGYWIIGMAEPHFQIFEDMPWSTPRLAEETRRRAGELGLTIAELRVKSDIDTRAELDRLPEPIRRRLGLGPSP